MISKISNTKFINLHAYSGDAVCFKYNTKLSIFHCLFANCSADYLSGAVYAECLSMSITASCMFSCSAVGSVAAYLEGDASYHSLVCRVQICYCYGTSSNNEDGAPMYFTNADMTYEKN